MRTSVLIFGLIGSALAAQTPVTGAPGIKWRGSFWASGITQDRSTPDGSVVFRPLESGEDRFTLDGLTLGADVPLPEGFSLKFTLMAGQLAKNINLGSGDTGSIAWPEAQLVWTGKNDTIRIGRMLTSIGMEFTDQTSGVAASKGILYTFADPLAQVGVNWHHAFTPVWSSDLWVFNGEDQVADNNRGKTLGVGLTYNHGGSADNYLSLQAYRGPEQSGAGAEGRLRERVCLMGQWVWGPATLQWEGTFGRESFASGTLAPEARTASWGGGGAIFRYALGERSALFARVESLKDGAAVRLGIDKAIAPLANQVGADLRLDSAALGYERKYGRTFMRLEVRQDRLNRELLDKEGDAFKAGTSATFLVGASF